MADDPGYATRFAASETNASRDDQLSRALEQVRIALSSLRYGQVLITVQDGVVLQIDRTEKIRLR